jgi:hypothetical protein
MKLLKLSYLSVALLIITGCIFSSRFQSSNPFYVSDGDWDFLRMPLIEPYEIIKGSEDLGWSMKLFIAPTEQNYYRSVKRIERIAIEENAILIHSSYIESSAEVLGKEILFWYVIIPDEKIEKGFKEEYEFQRYTQELGIINPKWIDPLTAFQQFEKTGCLDWIPDCKALDE